jgi:formiminotetrahydrofolate cyclodeaminase
MAEDQLAYSALSLARKLPENSPEKAAQSSLALHTCIRIPQAIAATSVTMLELSDRIINFVNPQLLSDLAVCCDLAMATARCAAYSVRANMCEVSDPLERQHSEATITQLLSRAAGLIQKVAPRIWARHSQET